MQEEGGAKGVNPALEKHWEKLVLAVVVILAVIFIGTKLSAGGSSAAKSVDTASAEYRRRVDLKNDKIEAPKSISEKNVPASVATNRPPDWTPGLRTIHRPDIRVTKELPVTFRFPDLTMGAPDPSPTGSTLTWTVAKIEKDPNPKRGDPIVVAPTTFFFKIDRKVKGGDWETIEKELKSDKESVKYVDDNTAPKTDYEYRVTLGSTDPAFVKSTPSRMTNKTAGPVTVSTPGIWQFEFSNMLSFPDEDVPKPGQAYVTIRKYDKTHGLVEWRGIQYEGEELGVTKEGSIHRTTTAAGKAVAVDFKGGGKIKKVTTDKVVLYTYKQCNPTIDDKGVKDCKGPEDRKGEYKVNEVLYTDEDGKDQSYTTPSGPGPIADKLCEDHGGPPPVKELSPEEKAAKRDAEAINMLDEADELWTSDKAADKRRAQAIYRKLAESYQDVPAMKSRKGDVTERSRKKID